MSQCRFRASDATATLRSQVLGYMGSTEAIKSLVEPVIRFVQRRFERMVLEQGGVLEGVFPVGEPASPYMCQRARPGTAPVTAHGSRPLAPPVQHGDGGLLPIFPSFLAAQLLPFFSN
jgi:hypothetical protein